MPGHNHPPWCICGWCYKNSGNGYSARVRIDMDRFDAQRALRRAGADRSWSACFVDPNASCPVCGERVFYYQNQFGSRVFFDNLGWPWPKHPCTERSRSAKPNSSWTPPSVRKRGEAREIIEAAGSVDFDPNAEFRDRFGSSPWDLLLVSQVHKSGFEIRIEAKSICPSSDDQVYLTFTSSKFTPRAGDFFGFDGAAVSFLETETLEPKQLKAKLISKADYGAFRV